ncbi:AMP-binding protein [Roseococcus sp.]|uniref:AMP-binding protein n=1 Tax=Roseococcus sp. TaxID=2109646 RepID=UPI003BAA9F71
MTSRNAASYEQWRREFRWDIPERFNIARVCCDRWADGSGRPALLREGPAGLETLTFDELQEMSRRFANVLLAQGIRAGDRVAILLPQSWEVAVAHLAIYRMGAIAVPLFALFGADAIAYRLADCDARAIVTHTEALPKLPQGPLVILTDGPGALDFHAEMARASPDHLCADTAAEDPALIIYTSGTTGAPKGALHAHRVLLGHLPGVEMPQDLFPQPGDLFWTPADWAWIGGLLDVLLPSLFHGVPVLALRMEKFDPERAFHTIARHKLRNLFLPPTALRLMRQVPHGRARPRSIGSGGETLGAEMLEWGREAFGVTINEFYGQTECNLIVSSCGALFPPRPGWVGRAVPGHEVAITGGEIAVKSPDPVMFLRYWNRPEDTAAKYRDGWLMTGDAGEMDDEGFIRFLGRSDDVITSAGYRIGPAEVEDCLMRHPAVAAAAVVGIPDALRTEAVAAAIVLRAGEAPSDDLARRLQEHVKTRLAGHLYPRHIRFVAELPQTATGKIMRRVLRQDWDKLP